MLEFASIPAYSLFTSAFYGQTAPPPTPMDQPKRPSDKTYSELMNEWSAQKNFVKGNRSRLIHPPWNASPGAKFFGYFWRFCLLVILPSLIYARILHTHGSSKELREELAAGISQTLAAGETEIVGSRWKLDGMLSINELRVKGGPDSFFEKLEAGKMGTRIPIPAVFRRQWILPRISIQDLNIALRSGARGTLPEALSSPVDDIRLPSLDSAPDGSSLLNPTPKTGAVEHHPAPTLLTAGFGINPDYTTLTFNALQIAKLTSSWGTGPSTVGSVQQMQTDVSRTGKGWQISGSGGKFQWGWLQNLTIAKLAAEVLPAKAVIHEAIFTKPAGDRATLTGDLTFGEFPEVTADLTLQDVHLQDFANTASANLFTAEANGTLKVTGSLNRSAGIRMEGTLAIASGRIVAVPLLKALHQLTREEQFRLLTIHSGKIDLVSTGSEEHGGQIVELKSFEANCGSLAKIKGHYRQEQVRAQDLSARAVPNRNNVSGLIRLGISERAHNQLKPAVAAQFFRKEEEWYWMDLPIQGTMGPNFSQAEATALLKANEAIPAP